MAGHWLNPNREGLLTGIATLLLGEGFTEISALGLSQISGRMHQNEALGMGDALQGCLRTFNHDPAIQGPGFQPIERP